MTDLTKKKDLNNAETDSASNSQGSASGSNSTSVPDATKEAFDPITAQFAKKEPKEPELDKTHELQKKQELARKDDENPIIQVDARQNPLQQDNDLKTSTPLGATSLQTDKEVENPFAPVDPDQEEPKAYNTEGWTPNSQTVPKIGPGDFGRRVLSALLDNVICYVFAIPYYAVIMTIYGLFLVAASSGEEPGSIAVAFSMFFLNIGPYIVKFGYYTYFYMKKGSSPGKLVQDMQVVDVETGNRLTFGQCFIREFLGPLVNLMTCGIGYLIPLFRDDARALHDLMAGTQVIRKIS